MADWREQYEKNKESHNRATAKYQKENMKFMGLRWHVKNDADVLAKLDSVPNKVNYIRTLIRDDIARTGWKPPAQERPVMTEETRRLLGL